MKEEAFTKAYNELCEKHGLQISITLVWVPRDDGTWSTKINRGIIKYERGRKDNTISKD